MWTPASRSVSGPVRCAAPRARPARANSRRFQRIRVEAGQQNGDQRRGEEHIDLALDAVVNLDDARGLLFVFVVLDQQSGDGGAERRLTRLQRELELLARVVSLPVARESEHAIDGVPELGEGTAQKRALLGSAAGWRRILP